MDLMARRRAIMGMPSGEDYTISNANVISISDALAKNAKSLVVSFSPKQSGSGDPSPNNVRPITGYNDIGAVRYGKNMWSMTACVGCSYNPAQGTVFDTTPATLQPTDNGDGSFSVTISSWGRVCFIVPVPNGASVRSSFSRSGAGGRRTIGWLDADKKVIGTNWNNTDASENYSSTWTASGGAKYLFFVFTSNTASTQTITYPQVELGSTATSYEPYISPVTANVHSDTTIFGGTVDLVSGELKVTGMLETFITDDGNAIVSQLNSFSKQSTGVGTIGSYTRISFAVRGDVDQTQYNRASNTYATPLCNYAKHYFAYNSESTHWYRNTVLYLFLPTSLVGSTAQSVYDWLKSIMNTEPLSMWVDFATPITYHLTPSQLALLKGNNTIYSNEGSISLTYVGK